MSETTKRYRIDGTHGEYGRWTYNGMEPDESGQWVKYDDHIDALAAAQRENERLREELENIARANWRTWDPEMRSPDEFVRWAQSRATAALRGEGGA